MSAIENLNPESRLSDQLELLSDDLSLDSLATALPGDVEAQLVESVTAAEISRTIEGASTLALTLLDRDRALLESGYLGDNLDVKLDGLWFRLVAFGRQGDALTLTFEDREVALLRKYPLASAEMHGRLLRSVHLTNRLAFAESLVAETSRLSEIPIRFNEKVAQDTITSSRDRPSGNDKRVGHQYGFPPGAKITVQHAPATPEQVKNTERVLDVGASMGVPSIIMVAAVMVIDDESGARNLPGGDRDSVGIFQQRPSGGRPDGKGAWPATFDIEQQAHAFFEVAVYLADKFARGDVGPDPGPPAPVTAANVAAFCSEIQRDATWGTDHQGSVYGRYQDEAVKSVALYLGTDSGTVTQPSSPVAGSVIPITPPTDLAGFFYRGNRVTRNGRTVWERESNWDCLGRLAQEVGWKRYVVSGTVYFMPEQKLFAGAPQMTLGLDTPGVYGIDGEHDNGKKTSQLTVSARCSRWGAPPGTVVAVEHLGPLSGRWLVSEIRRDVFESTASITLAKPTPALPEGKAPEYGKGDQSGGTYKPGPKKPRQGTVDPKAPWTPPSGGTRDRIVAVAMHALAVEQQWHYHYDHQRPANFGLFTSQAHSPGIDCSAFATLVYKTAGAPDPNGRGYDGEAFTGLIAGHCTPVDSLGLGDLVLYGDPYSIGGHVAVHVGQGLVVEIGSENGILLIQADYRTDRWHYVTCPGVDA